MGRAHAWITRSEMVVDPRDDELRDNLPMIRAIRADRWIATRWEAAIAERLAAWVERRLVPEPRGGDVVLKTTSGRGRTPIFGQSSNSPARRSTRLVRDSSGVL